MLKVATRAELDALSGRKPAQKPAQVAAPAPASPPAPATSPVIEQALAELSRHVQQVATIAAQASAGVAALAARPDVVMVADVQRDTQGRMERIIIKRKN